MKVAKFLLSPLLAVTGLLDTKPAEQAAVPTPPMPDAAAEAARRDDELRRRRGQGANVATGAGGAEASTPGGKVLLGS